MAIDFGNLADGRPIWIDDFTGDTKTDILFFSPVDDNWWRGWFDSNQQLQWSLVAHTGFGNIGDGRPVWISDFTGDGKSDVLFYYSGTGNWWLGSFDDQQQLLWYGSGTPPGFGDMADGRPLFMGDFSGSGKTELLFFNPPDGNWWLSSLDDNKQLQWQQAGNSFGFNIGGGYPVLAGNFTGAGKAEILFHYPPDGNWWLGGLTDDNQLQWNAAGSTPGFDIITARPILTGDFNGDGLTDILFYHPASRNWWFGRVDGDNQVRWSLVSNSAGFGDLADGRPVYAGNFSAAAQTDVIFYTPGDRNWWRGRLDATDQLQWNYLGNTTGFGNLADGRPVFAGDFNQDGRAEFLFYNRGDGNWWTGQIRGKAQLQWNLVGNTGAKSDHSFWHAIGGVITTIVDVLTTVVYVVVQTVESLLSPVLGVVGLIVGLILTIPYLGRAISQIFRVGQLIVNVLLVAGDLLAGLIGIKPEKKLKLLVFIQLDERGQPVTTEADVEAELAYAINVFKEQANVRIISARPFTYTTPFSDLPRANSDYVYTARVNSTAATLDVNCDAKAWRADLGPTGAAFNAKMLTSPAFFSAGRGLLGLGTTLCAFAVRSFQDPNNGCSLGPLTDYILVQFSIKNPLGSLTLNSASTLAHEIGHACNLLHRSGANLMASGDPPRQPLLTRWQVLAIRASRFVSYF